MRRALAAFTVVVASLAFAAPAHAGDDVTVRAVDATAFPAVRVSVRVGGDAVEASSIALSENGVAVPGARVVPMRETSAQVGTVLVLDTSIAMRTDNRLAALKAAAQAFVAGRPANELIELVVAGAPARVVLGFTQDRARIRSVIDGLGSEGGLALWDAVTIAANNLGDRRDLQPDIVVVAGGPDRSSDGSLDRAVAAAQVSKSLIFATAVQGTPAFDTAGIRRLADATGGSYLEASDATVLAGAIGRLAQAMDSQFEIDYTSTLDPANPPPIDITVRVGTAAVNAMVAPGTIASGANVRPQVATPPWSPSFLRGSTGKIVASATVVAAAVLFAIGFLLIVQRDRSDLTAALRHYTDEPGETGEAGDGVVLVETGFVRRAVDTTARLADDKGLLEMVEQRLEQAAVPVRAAEALFFWLAAVALATVLGLFMSGVFGAIIAVFLVGLGPAALLNQLAGRRKRAFTSLLPDTLQMFSSTLRSGFSLLQGVEAVSQEVADPMGSELRRVLVEARLGRPLEDALQDAADRMGSADFDWAVMAIRIQREVGGNLAELLETVGQTMVQRERLRGEVKGLTAEGRMSAIVLGLLPLFMGIVMYTLNPKYTGQLFTESLGKMMLVGGTVLAIAGFVWMKKMIEIEA